jgi:hypothetical protein
MLILWEGPLVGGFWRVKRDRVIAAGCGGGRRRCGVMHGLPDSQHRDAAESSPSTYPHTRNIALALLPPLASMAQRPPFAWTKT